MKIRSVEAIWLRVPIPEEKRHTSSYGRADAFDTVLVRIATECGLVGHGEGKSSVFTASDNHALVQIVEKEYAPRLIGQDPRAITRLWDEMYNGVRVGYAVQHGRAFPAFGRRGISLAAISGIDVACWDILGQSLNAPIWQLLGGKRRDRMPAYASGGWADADGIGAQLLGYCQRGGFKAVKMRVGAADGSVLASARRVRAAREALGPDIDLMCDAHGTLNVAEAKRFCRLVEDCNIAWFEEPVGPDDKRGMAEVRVQTDIPIAAGESEVTRFEFRDLILAGCGRCSATRYRHRRRHYRNSTHRSALRGAPVALFTTHLGWSAVVRRRRPYLRRRHQFLHPRIFAWRQSDAARACQRIFSRGGRVRDHPRPSGAGHQHRRRLRQTVSAQLACPH